MSNEYRDDTQETAYTSDATWLNLTVVANNAVAKGFYWCD